MTDGVGDTPETFQPQERPSLGGSSSVPGSTSKRSESRKGGWLSEITFVLLVALALSVVVKTFLLQSFYIPSSSMESTLLIDDRIIVNKLADSIGELHRGDVVVFVDPGGWLPEPPPPAGGIRGALTSALTFVGVLPQNAGEHLIKRVIGIEGDIVECCDAEGRLMVNGVPIDEPYLDEGVQPSEVEFAVEVPAGHMWLMGDNRQDSRDSRAHIGSPGGGMVPEASVEGRAAYIVFPFERMTWLGGEDSAFAAVP